jgi:F1F0 ATPase subunit 2
MSTVFFASMTASILAGLLLGGWYFAGLWWTLRRLPGSTRPIPLYLLSLAVRLVVIAIAFYGVIKWFDWLHLLACLAAFLVARLLLIAYLVKSDTPEAWGVKNFF